MTHCKEDDDKGAISYRCGTAYNRLSRERTQMAGLGRDKLRLTTVSVHCTIYFKVILKVFY